MSDFVNFSRPHLVQMSCYAYLTLVWLRLQLMFLRIMCCLIYLEFELGFTKFYWTWNVFEGLNRVKISKLMILSPNRLVRLLRKFSLYSCWYRSLIRPWPELSWNGYFKGLCASQCRCLICAMSRTACQHQFDSKLNYKWFTHNNE